MIQLWSAWNFSWFLLGKNNLVPFNHPLKASIFVTSLLGGYMIYIYPRKITIKIGNYKIKPSYSCLVMGDILFHQIPMAYVLYIENKKELNTLCSKDNTCGAWVLLPFSGWYLTSKILRINFDKIYGIKMNYLVGAACTLFTGHSLFYHLLKNKKD
jgi:hypothetical protein